ncbi:cystatin-A isoform X1 [Hydra vulgaris]
MTLCGGTSESRPADDEVKAIIEKIKDQVLGKVNQSLDQYEAVSYKTQVVAGTNFFIKVKTGDNRFIHLRVFRPLPPNFENFQLHSVQENKSHEDEISYF